MDERIKLALDLLREAIYLFSDLAHDDNVDSFTRGLACCSVDILRVIRDRLFDPL